MLSHAAVLGALRLWARQLTSGGDSGLPTVTEYSRTLAKDHLDQETTLLIIINPHTHKAVVVYPSAGIAFWRYFPLIRHSAPLV